jgi:hypothetical protein
MIVVGCYGYWGLLMEMSSLAVEAPGFKPGENWTSSGMASAAAAGAKAIFILHLLARLKPCPSTVSYAHFFSSYRSSFSSLN